MSGCYVSILEEEGMSDVANCVPRSRTMRKEMHIGEMATLHFPQRLCARVASGRFHAAGSLTAPQRAVSTTCAKTWGRQRLRLCTQHGSQCVGFFPTGFSSAVQQQRPDNKLPVGRGSPLVDHRSSAGT